MQIEAKMRAAADRFVSELIAIFRTATLDDFRSAQLPNTPSVSVPPTGASRRGTGRPRGPYGPRKNKGETKAKAAGQRPKTERPLGRVRNFTENGALYWGVYDAQETQITRASRRRDAVRAAQEKGYLVVEWKPEASPATVVTGAPGSIPVTTMTASTSA